MPKKADEREGSRHPISFRTTAELRAKLEDAASKSGRSLTQELEHRLERSFIRDELREHIDGLLSDSLIKGEEVDKATARIAELEAQVEALKQPLDIIVTKITPAFESATEHVIERVLQRIEAQKK